jgi:AGCS family alanine or glycine:cation symporter
VYDQPALDISFCKCLSSLLFSWFEFSDLQADTITYPFFAWCAIKRLILTSDINLLSFDNLNGIELVQLSFFNHIGSIGKLFVFIIIFTFSFTTILSSYYNGESSLKYFIEKPKLLLMFLKLLTFISIIMGAISKSNFIWNLIDIFVGLLAIINIYAIIKLKDEVFELLKIK